KDRRDHRVQEELHRRIHLAPVAEHSDQQRHGNERGFPEEVEEEQIKGDEDADESGFHDQQQNKKFLYPVVDGVPRDQHAQRSKECGEDHQPQRNSIHAHVIMNIGMGDPGAIDLELKAAPGAVKVRRQVQRDNEVEQRDDQRENADVAVAPRKEQKQQSASQRNKRDQRENRGIESQAVHRVPTQTM